MVSVRLQMTGFNLNAEADKIPELLWTLPAIAGLCGVCMRITSGFMVRLGGGIAAISITLFCLFIPVIGLGTSAGSENTPFIVFYICAAFSGIGGGIFITCMDNVSRLFPQDEFYFAATEGFGSLGVCVSFLLIPLFVCLPSKQGYDLTQNDWVDEGKASYVNQAGWLWVPLVTIALAGAVFYTNGSVNEGKDIMAVIRLMCYGLSGCIFAVIGGAFTGFSWLICPLVPCSIALPLVLVRYFPPGAVKAAVERRFDIFYLPYTYFMCTMGLVTFGSYIGFAFCMPKLINDVFGFLPNGNVNPNAPYASSYAWIGPLVGVLIRPFGWWLSEKMSASRVVTLSTILQIVFIVPIGLTLDIVKDSTEPDTYFLSFITYFVLEFFACGIGIVGLYRQISQMIPCVFKEDQRDSVYWAMSCSGALGAFILPMSFGLVLNSGHGAWVILCTVIYYLICLVVHVLCFELECKGSKGITQQPTTLNTKTPK